MNRSYASLSVFQSLEARLLKAGLETLSESEIPLRMEEVVSQAEEVSTLNFDVLQRDLMSGMPLAAKDVLNPYRFVLTANDQFFIEALMWVTDTTSLHDHPFTGLAVVLEGESVNLTFDFTEEGTSNGLRWGQLNPIGIQTFTRGHKFPFSLGRNFAHRVLHLSPRCCTLRIGLNQTKLKRDQWNYVAPGFGVASISSHEKEALIKFRLASRLYPFFPNEFRDGFRRMLETEMASTAVWYLLAFQGRNNNYDVYEELIKDVKGFSAPLKRSIQLALEHCVGNSFFRGETFKSPGSLLLTGLAENFGLGKQTRDCIAQVAHKEGVSPWLKKSLIDIALSTQFAKPVAWHLLDRMKGVEATTEPNQGVARPSKLNGQQASYFEKTWRISEFENFLRPHAS